MTKFIKMHGLGNDFVIFDHRNGTHAYFTEDQIRLISDRRLGVGCNQFIVMEHSTGADFFMRIYNSDGSVSEACGNATRCVADRYMKEQGTDQCIIDTLAGHVHCWKHDDFIAVDMGAPRYKWHEIPLSHETDTLSLPIEVDNIKNPVAVSMGNPHCVCFVKDLNIVDTNKTGQKLENYDLFPNKTNVQFAKIIDKNNIRIKIWERGAGYTMASGSSSCAVLTAAVRRGLTDRKANIIMDGGTLTIEWKKDTNHIHMIGPVAYVFEGNLKV